MPETMTKQLDFMHRFAKMETAGVLGWLAMLIAALLAGVRHGHTALGLVLLALSCVWLAAMFLLEGKVKRRARALEPYEIPVSIHTAEQAASALSAETGEAQTYRAARMLGGAKARIFMQHRQQDEADAPLQFTCGADAPYERHAVLRINLLLCGKKDEAVTHWVQKEADKRLHKKESRIHAALALDEGLLLLPAVLDSLTFSELKRYRIALQMLIDCLQCGCPEE